MKFNLTGFKKIGADEKSTTLQHPQGHQIKIAHSAIHPKMRGELAAMPIHKMDNGGKATNAEPKSDPSPAPSDSPVDQDKWKQMQKGFNSMGMAGGGEVYKYDQYGNIIGKNEDKAPETRVGESITDDLNGKKQPPKQMADGGDAKIPPPAVKDDTATPATQDSGPLSPESVGKAVGAALRGAVGDAGTAIKNVAGAVGGPILNAGKGLMEGAMGNDKPPANGGGLGTMVPNGTNSTPQGIPALGNPEGAAAPSSSISPGGGDQPQSPGASPQGSADPFGAGLAFNTASQGLQSQLAGVQNESQAQSELGEQQAKVLANQQAAQQQAQDDFKSHFQALNDKRQAIESDISNSHIDPNRYMGNMDTGKKFLTGIGMILSGFGGGASGQGNMAEAMLQRNIDRDIDAQKADLGKKQNLLAANLADFGNLHDATNMTRVMMNDQLANQLKTAEAQAISPMAKARAQMARGQILTQNASLIGQMSARKTLMSGVSSGSLQPEALIRAGVVPKEDSEDFKKQAQAAQNAISLRDDVLNAFDQVAKINTLGNRALNPLQSQYQLDAIKGPILDKLTKDKSSRVTPETVKLVGAAFSHMGSDAETTAKGRQSLNALLTQDMNFPVAKAYGIDVNRMGRYDMNGVPRFNERPAK